MIELYSSRFADADIGTLLARGRDSLSRGRLGEAITVLFSGLRQAHVSETEYAKVCIALHDAFVASGSPREALSVAWYLRDRSLQEPLLAQVPPVDRGRTLLSWAEGAGPLQRKLAHQAAETLETAGLLVRSAIAFETAGEWDEARALWSRLSPRLTSSANLYEAALAQFNLFRTSQKVGDARAARAASVQAVHLLEEAADRYEQGGQRERAFDCYRVLIAIGRETRTFEHQLEGFVNALRILQGDHLRQYALDTFEEAIAAARDEGELVAAATLCRELSTFARKEGQEALACQAAMREAELWRLSASASVSQGAPVSMVEHALLAAVLALGEIGQYRAIGAIYPQLAQLPLDEQKRAHYARASERYLAARDEPLDEAPPHGARTDGAFPAVWHVDLLEHEEAGSASEACASLLLSTSQRVFTEISHRRALVSRLVALAADRAPPAEEDAARALLCERLVDLQSYELLSSLERMATHDSPRVREAVMRTLAEFRFKRSFATLRRGLDDADANVSQAAASAIETLHFPHAIEPLSRIHRESTSPLGRQAAIKALAEIDRPEAAEILLGVLAYGAPDDRECAVRALVASKRKAFVQVAKVAMADLDANTRKLVREIFKAKELPI